MRETTLVHQRLPADCSLCCMAMLTGRSYVDVFMAAPFGEEEFTYGLTFIQVIMTLRRLGYRPNWHHPEKLSPNNIGVPLREKMRGKVAMHLVPSIHKPDEGTYHYVLVKDGRIYDPSPAWKRRYRRYEQLLPLGAVFLAE